MSAARWVLFACVALAGCRAGKSVVSVTVQSTGITVPADEISLHLKRGTQTADVSVPVKVGNIPPSLSFSLVFDASVSGEVLIEGQLVKDGVASDKRSAMVQIAPGASLSALLDFGNGGLPADAGDDASVGDDMAEADAAVDAGRPRAWKVVQSGMTYNLIGVWVGELEAVAVGLEPNSQTGVVLTRALPNGAWTQVKQAPADYPLLAVWGVGRELFAAGGGMTVLHRSVLGGWSNEVVDPNPNLSSRYLNTVWAGGGAVYTAGEFDAKNPLVYRSTGNGQWVAQKNPAAVYSIDSLWGRSPNDVYAVGQMGGLFHYNGATWSPTTIKEEADLTAIWGSDRGELFVPTAGGAVWRRTQGVWASTLVDNTGVFLGVWGNGPEDVFVVGDAGGFWHFDGQGWSAAGPKPPLTEPLFGISGNAAGHVVVVGKGGLIVESD